MRWPDDGPQLIEQQWDRIGPGLDALTEQTGVRRLSCDEAAAFPGMSTIAVMLTLLDDGQSRPRVLVADPGVMAGFMSTITNLTYAQRRVLPMPLDILASLNRKLRGAAAMGTALSTSGELLAQMRTRGRWAGLVQVDGERGQRVERQLALAGIAVLPADRAIDQVLTNGLGEAADPWLEIEHRDEEYELFVRAPGLRKDSISLARAGDDLVVTVDGVAHPIELPGGLKRCVVTGGSVRHDGLRVVLRPEGGKWRD